MAVLYGLIGACALALGALDGYQAVTGNRVSRRPSRRTDEQMRRQSAIAAAVLAPMGLLVLTLALLG